MFMGVVRIASWIFGTSAPLKKGPSARGLLDRAALSDRHASRAWTVGTCVPPLRVEMAPPYPTPVLLHAFRCLHPKRAGALLRDIFLSKPR